MKTHRKDIDGLRAIAILLVVFYHLGAGFAATGFIGVDVFFVISGFLITQHILSDIQHSKFSLKAFYLKRLRRIFPALIFVLFVTTIAAYLFLLPKPLVHYSDSMLHALFISSNFYFHQIQQNYFAPDADELPLLHTWTLGVEEQFYIIWPLLLLVIIHFFRQRGALIFTILFCAASFTCYYVSRSGAPGLYYLPTTRAFELLIGALLAMHWTQLRTYSAPWLNHLFSMIGIASIVYAGCFLQISDYPSFYILLPCLGAALLIYAGGGENKAIGNQILSNRLLVFIGLISYSLYLWHWPFIAFAHVLLIPIDFQIASAIFIVSFLLAVLTWYFIEQPFRFNEKYKAMFLKILGLYILFAIGISVLFHLAPYVAFNLKSRQAYEIEENFAGPFVNCIDGDLSSTKSSEISCSIGNTSLNKDEVLIVGDSHAMSEVGMLNVWLKDRNLKGYVATKSGTVFISGNIPEWNDPIVPNKMARNKTLESIIQSGHYKYVVMGAFWGHYPNSRWGTTSTPETTNNYSILETGLENATKLIIKAGSTPIIIMDFPILSSGTMPFCGFTKFTTPEPCSINQASVLQEQNQTRNIIFKLKKQYPQIVLIDFTTIICDQGQCKTSIQGIPLYQGGGHLNYPGSTLIGQLYLKKYGNPFPIP
jgi:peptidoglycan/LPS O-acetylase OafA/YrhL